MTTSVIVGSIFFTGYQLLRMEELTVGSRSDFIHNSRLKVDEDSSWNVFTSSSFAEESVEGIVSASDGFVAGHLTIRLDSMLQTVQLPARVSDLDTGLANVD